MSIPLVVSVDVSVGEVKRRTADDDNVVVSASIHACSQATYKLVTQIVKKSTEPHIDAV